MTLRTKDGRPLCEVRDPMLGPVLNINPMLYNVLRRVVEEKLTCTVELNFNAGGLGRTHIRMDGERFAGCIVASVEVPLK